MKRAALVVAALAATVTATAATVRTATEGFVTNKIAEAIATLPVSGIDAATATNIAESAAAAATNALSGSLSSTVSAASAASTNYTDSAIIAATNDMPRITPADGLDWPADWAENAVEAFYANEAFNADEAVESGGLKDGFGRTRTANVIFAQLDAATETNAAQTAALAALPAAVTNIVREASGGIWDAALEVWWTPRMRNGSLTYEATTNVNLNAEN